MAKQVTCINAKNYALTKGNPYIILGSTRDMYNIENDKNKIASYSKKLFEEIRQAIVEEVVEEPVVNPTLDSIKEALVINMDVGRAYDFDITYNVGRRNYNASPSLSLSGSEISCGVNQIYNLNAFSTSIYNFGQRFNTINAEERRELTTHISKTCFELIKENTSCMAVLSTNTNHNRFSIVDTGLEELTDSHETAINSNSGNTIKTWLLNCVD